MPHTYHRASIRFSSIIRLPMPQRHGLRRLLSTSEM